MFAQNPAFGYCVPPCVDEEKSLSRVKVFRTPCWLLVRRIFKSASKLFYSRLCILEWEQVLEGVLEQVPERVSGAGSRAFPQRLPERVFSVPSGAASAQDSVSQHFLLPEGAGDNKS
eukprot:s1446_g5.t1